MLNEQIGRFDMKYECVRVCVVHSHALAKIVLEVCIGLVHVQLAPFQNKKSQLQDKRINLCKRDLVI